VKKRKLIKILVVFGTRPEAIKMLPLINQLKLESKYFDLKICITAQHRTMLDQILNFFQIKPDIDFNLMKQKQDLNLLTSKILVKMKKILRKNKPDLVIVHGDTTTTMAASLSSFYEGFPVAHVEAGLRTYNLKAPFPEEFNRQFVSKIAKFHFSPTSINKTNLIAEGVNKKNIKVTGNTVIDALFWTLKKINSNSTIQNKIERQIKSILKFNYKKDRFILITGHRRENFGDGFVHICEAIRDLALLYPKINFIYPVHLNPNVQKPVNKILKNLGNVLLIKPMNYENFIYLMKYAYLILTDSGGIQEEAPSLRKPVLVMRKVTERKEAINTGNIKLIGNKKKNIIFNVRELLKNENMYMKMCNKSNPYGDGFAAKRIVDFLKNLYFKEI